MEIIEIRAFSPEVLAAVNRMLPQLSATARQLTAADLMGIVDAGAAHLYMAREAGQWLGTLTLVIFDIPTGRRARIEDVVVDSAARGRGIGRQLIARALAAAADLGAQKVDLTANPSRTSANALYEKMGFRRRETNVYHLSVNR